MGQGLRTGPPLGYPIPMTNTPAGPATEYTVGTVDIDGQFGPLPALIPNELWNGFDTPLFTRETVNRIAETVRTWIDNEYDLTITWDHNIVVMTDQTTTDDDGQPFVERLTPVLVDGVSYWQVGRGWTWDSHEHTNDN